MILDSAPSVSTTPPPLPKVETATGWRPSRPSVTPDLTVRMISALGIVALWFSPTDLPPDARTTLVVFATAVWLWVFSSVSDTFVALGAASVLVVIEIISVDDFFGPLGDQTTWLLIGAFILAGGVTSSGLALRVAVALAAGVTSARVLVHVLTLAIVLTAFAVPATSGRAALVLPVFVVLLGVLPSWLSQVLALALPSVVLFSAVASLIGAGAHLITDQILTGEGLEGFSFTRWMILGLPLALTSSHFAAEIILQVFSTGQQRAEPLDLQREVIGADLSVRLSPAETRSLSILVVAVILWFTETLHGIPAAMVAVLGALFMTSPHLGATDLGPAIKKVPWSLLLFMTATVALSQALSSSGAADILASGVFGAMPAWLFVVTVIAVSTAAHLIIQSRSARSAVLVPLVIATAPAAGVDPVAAAFISTAAAGFCHTLPASAKPLAIFRGDGPDHYYEPRDLIVASVWLAPMHLVVMVAFAFFIWPLLGLPVFL